ncbi:MAG TPA: carboxypeptidase-like regulatory domain-containing protein, partial [Vicinamibacterales bacterium]|nr:carboxypeptidase-like regulatory domain-containing protein [Vicinamibacterales bacterium]
MKTLKASVACVLAIGLLLPAVAFAQTDARFAGVVLDPSGAVVPGATVLVKNERTGEERTVVTNAEGRYIVPNLRPSVYTITATFGQLAPLKFDGLQLVAGQEFPLDLTLQAAGVTETVT